MTRPPLRRGNWSVAELARLRQLFPRSGIVATARLLRRSPDSVRKKVVELFRVPPQRGPWQPADDLTLRRGYGVVELRLLALVLGRQPQEVERRAATLRAAPATGAWTRAELALLKECYGTRGSSELEVCLQRTAVDIEARARVLCLAKDKRYAAAQAARAGGASRRMPRWSPAEVARLRDLYPGADNLEVARQLGRSVAAVANKANLLGLQKSPSLLARIGRENVAVRYVPAALPPALPAARPADAASGEIAVGAP